MTTELFHDFMEELFCVCIIRTTRLRDYATTGRPNVSKSRSLEVPQSKKKYHGPILIPNP